MKIGILTYHHLPNYGAALQATALHSFLKSLGHRVEIIDYRQWEAELRAYKDIFNSLARGSFREATLKYKKIKAFSAFMGASEKVSDDRAYYYSRCHSLMKAYDCLICGSDEIWNLANYRGYAPAYFLSGSLPVSVKRIAYAVSCGHCNTFGEYAQKIREDLLKFDIIMVRDSKTGTLVKEEIGLGSQPVIDPVFLWDFQESLPRRSSNKPYLLITGVLKSDQVGYARKIATERNLHLVGAGYSYPSVSDCRVDIGPAEWMGLIANAEFVISSLFHATAFAIKYQRSFRVFVSKAKEAKIVGMLENLGLKDRILRETPTGGATEENISAERWERVTKDLAQAVAQSAASLEEAVNEECKITD